MKNTDLLNAISQFLNAIPKNGIDEKIDLVLNKLETIEQPQKNADENEYLLIDEVCRLTRKTRVTIWSWRKKGILIPIGKSGKNPLYKKSDVIAFIHNQNVVC